MWLEIGLFECDFVELVVLFFVFFLDFCKRLFDFDFDLWNIFGELGFDGFEFGRDFIDICFCSLGLVDVFILFVDLFIGGVWDWGLGVVLVDDCLLIWGDGVFVWICFFLLLDVFVWLEVGICCWMILEFVFNLVGIDLFFVLVC